MSRPMSDGWNLSPSRSWYHPFPRSACRARRISPFPAAPTFWQQQSRHGGKGGSEGLQPSGPCARSGLAVGWTRRKRPLCSAVHPLFPPVWCRRDPPVPFRLIFAAGSGRLTVSPSLCTSYAPMLRALPLLPVSLPSHGRASVDYNPRRTISHARSSALFFPFFSFPSTHMHPPATSPRVKSSQRTTKQRPAAARQAHGLISGSLRTGHAFVSAGMPLFPFGLPPSLLAVQAGPLYLHHQIALPGRQRPQR